jgi:galactokinase
MRPLAADPSFVELFGHAPQVKAAAHGRVNLMGDHTDYNGGYVLPTTIPQQTQVELALTAGPKVRLLSARMDPVLVEYVLGKEHRAGDWSDYVQGITHVLSRDGIAVQGFDLQVHSDIPVGSGLSSSAALEIAVLKGLREALHLPLNDIDLAKIGRRAENEFVGAPVGIMDQMACLLAKANEALFLNTANLVSENIAVPAGIEVVVIDSGIAHSHATGEYRVRRQECEEAARRLGVDNLSQLSSSDLSMIYRLPQPLYRRVKHVVTENQRVLDTVVALRADDRPALRKLFYDSHQSLAEDYEVSVPPIDFLIDHSKEDAAIIGARITGGGFGGCVAILAAKTRGRKAAQQLISVYQHRFDHAARVLVPVEAVRQL